MIKYFHWSGGFKFNAIIVSFTDAQYFQRDTNDGQPVHLVLNVDALSVLCLKIYLNDNRNGGSLD